MGRIERNDNAAGASDDVAAGYESEVARVRAVISIVAQHEVHAVGNHQRAEEALRYAIRQDHDVVGPTYARFAQQHWVLCSGRCKQPM